MATLVLLQGGEAIPYELQTAETTLGRHPDCEIQLDSNMVSRRHAKLSREGEQFYVEDLGSGNGSFVNGKKIEERTALNPGDRIKLGPILFRFQQGDTLPPSGEVAAHTETAAFRLDDSDGKATSTIMGSAATGGGFGALDVQPEAKLKAVLEITKSLAGTVDIDTLLPRILATLFNIFPHADRGAILLKDPESNRMLPRVYKHRQGNKDETVRLSRTIMNKVISEKAGILSADAASDDRFQASESISSLTIRSMLCVPMLDLDGETMGLINIDTQNAFSQFKQEDLDLLMAVAGQAALSYENARLLASYMEKQKQDNEMKIASDVQHALLPKVLPKVTGYEFYASYDAAQAVGGDYYDCMMLDDSKICVSFGDVAGKGVPGALIMSRMATVVQNTMQFVHDVEEAVKVINNHMCSNMVEGRFVTYVLAVIDLKTNELTLVNAGHMSPLFRQTDGRIDEFPDETIGIPIGIIEDYPYDVVTRTIEPGETVVIITDGVDEAMNPAGDLYGKERVRDFVRKGSPKANELGRALLEDVRKHANGRPQNDDITIMTFGRNA